MTTASVPRKEQERTELPFPVALVEELMKLLVKAVRAHQLYLQNNPVYLRAIELLKGGFAPIWARAQELTLAFSETEIRWMDRPVLTEPTKGADSLPWLFFKDGIREIRIHPGFETDELPRLLDIIGRARRASPEEDDLLTMLWEQDFHAVRYRYVDLSVESVPPVEGEPPPDLREAPEPLPTESEAEKRADVVRMEDFDATLYFLDDREIDYLRGEVKKEYDSDLRRNVVAVLLDIFEQQGDPAIRAEVAEILDHFMLLLLSAGQFHAVAYLLRETSEAGRRVTTLTPAHRERLAALPGRLSAPEALAQLLQSLDEAAELPPQEELTELFEQLQPTALATCFAWLGRLQNPKLRPLLENAAARLASQNTADLVQLIGSKDEAVALEAIRRAGAVKSAVAVAPLGQALMEASPPLRLAAVQSLAEVGSLGAMQTVERGLEDDDRDVRLATARAIAARTYRQGLSRVEAVVKGRAIRDADLTEKMALFEAYGALCGDAGVAYLDDLLNGKGFLGRREEPELRACAAMALGKIGTPAALGALRRAGNEKEIIVRNAVNRALRGGGT
ncbi:MAG TPA: HEAT repeat domain-containing protein [Gemmatimonadaceae bacterium]|nr:HEAT repeat domain-containing protein [Gemmatimonadaceae bacterium]